MKKTLILIVEDDHDILYTNQAALELEGYTVMTADTLAKGRSIAEEFSPDLIVLDIMLPDGSGLSYCEELRGINGVRILFLSALNTREDSLAGLRAGGDDYIAKPYDMEIFMARVEALLRRGKLIGADEPSIKIGGLELYFTSRRAMQNGRDILLKPKEFAVLEILMQNYGKAVDVNELYKKIWGLEPLEDIRTVREHISRIRSKLGPDSVLSIVSQRARGYRLLYIEDEKDDK